MFLVNAPSHFSISTPFRYEVDYIVSYIIVN